MPLNLPSCACRIFFFFFCCWCVAQTPVTGQEPPVPLVIAVPAGSQVLPPPVMIDPAADGRNHESATPNQPLCLVPELTTRQRLQQILLAARYGDVELLREAFAAVDELPVEEKFSPDPLRLAVEANEVETVRALLELGFDPNALSYRRLPLQFAINDGHERVVEVLLENGADPTAEVVFGDPLVLQALLRGYWRIAQRLLIAGAETEIPALHLAAGLGNRVAVLERLGSHPEELDEPWGPRDSTPLEFAVRNGHYLIAKTLLDRGAAAAGAPDIARDLVLLASRHGYEGLVELLLDYGAEGDFFQIARAAGPWHPEVFQVLHARGMNLPENPAISTQLLNAAVSDGQLETVRLLLRWGVPVRAVDRRGFTPLMCVFIKPDQQIFAELMSYARISPSDPRDPKFVAAVMALYQREPSPLSRFGLGLEDLPARLVERENRKTRDRGLMLAALRDAGLPLDIRDSAGRTLLWSALAQGYPADALQLLALGADPNAGPEEAQGPLGLGLRLPNRSPRKSPVITALLQAGAKPAPPRVEGVASPEFVALRNGCPRAAELLRRFQPEPANTLNPAEVEELTGLMPFRPGLEEYLQRHGYLTEEEPPADTGAPDGQN
jgi:ankyrin repeat protein